MKTVKTQLELQANCIDAALSLHKIPARVTGGTVTPRWVRFQVLPAVEANISEIKNLSKELAAALDAPNCRVSRRGAAVAIEIPRNEPYPVRLLPLCEHLADNQFSIPPATAILGLDEDGAPLLIRLPSSEVGHILVAGDEGAGKTTLLQAIVLSLAMTNRPDDLAFIFYGDGLPGMAQAIHQAGFPVHRITSMGAAVIKSAVRAAGKRVVFVADEVMGGNGSAQAFERLMKVERHHYILAWEGVPPKEIVDLFKVRLVGRVGNASEAKAATGRNGTGAERLMGRGDFLAMAEGRAIRFQAAHVSPEEIGALYTHGIILPDNDSRYESRDKHRQAVSNPPAP